MSFKPRKVLNDSSQKAVQPNDTKLKLFPHQLTMLHRVEEIEKSHGKENGYGILADQPGAGKTFVMLSLILNDKRRNPNKHLVNFIVVPQNIFEQWGQSIGRFSDELTCKKITYQDMIDYETLFDISIGLNKITHEKIIKSRKYYDIYLIPSTLYHSMVSTIEANVVVNKKGEKIKIFDGDTMFRRIIFDEIDTIANLLVHTIPTEKTWFMSASFTPSRMGVYQSYFNINAETANDFDPTYVCKCDDEYVFRNMKIPEPQKYNIQCYNPILDKIISKIPYYTKEDMKALNSYDYSKLHFQFVKKIPNNEDQLLMYSTQEFDEAYNDAMDKVKYYKENIDKMKAIEDERFDRHDNVYDFVDEIMPFMKSLGHCIYYFKNVGLSQTINDLNEVLKDEGQKKAQETMITSMEKGTYLNGLLKMMKMKNMSLENTNPYYMERYIEYMMLLKGNYENINPIDNKKMVNIIQNYEKTFKKFFQFITQIESEYTIISDLLNKFKLIDTLFQKYNSIMDKSLIKDDEKDVLIKIMKNFIEYYKKFNMVLKNSYFTYEMSKELIMSLEEFNKLNQTQRRVLYLNEGFEDMGKSNKNDFVNQVRFMIQTFMEYKVKLEKGLPIIKSMLEYVENYDNLRLYVVEFMKYTQIEKNYKEYVKMIKELTEENIDKKNRDPIEYEKNLNEIIHNEKIENVVYDVEMEITKIDIIHHILRLLKENPLKKRVVEEEEKKGRSKKKIEKVMEIDIEMKMMIFSDFSSIFKKITPLCDSLNIEYVQLDGGNMRSIENAVKQYKSGNAQILFCDSTLFGCGMNFENTTHVIFTHTPNPETQSQIIGRAQRIGRESILQVYQLHYPNEEMFNIMKKDTNSHLFHFMTAMNEENVQENKNTISNNDEEDVDEYAQDEDIGETSIENLE